MTTFARTSTLPLPTLDALNAQPCERNVLILLRSLYTSDLAWMYCLFDVSTVRDICDTCTRLLDDCVNGYPEQNIPANPLDMTPDEYTEARGYIAAMLDHMSRIEALHNESNSIDLGEWSSGGHTLIDPEF